MFAHDSRRDGVHSRTRFDDSQLGPDTDEWPGEQIRLLDDDYRSWRGDRYRRVPDDAFDHRHEDGQTPPPGDSAPAMPQRRGSGHRP